MKKKCPPYKKKGYAGGGPVDPEADPETVTGLSSKISQVAPSAIGMVPGQDWNNQMQGTRMGANAFAAGPVAGAIGMGAGFAYDMLAARSNSDKANAAFSKKRSAAEEINKRNSPYHGGGYGQMDPNATYADGGPVAHVIPAYNVDKAKKMANAAGVPELTEKLDDMSDRDGGIVPGNGGPRADDKVLSFPGAEKVRVSSGEMIVPDDLVGAFGGRKKVASLYPKAKYGSGKQDGGPVGGYAADQLKMIQGGGFAPGQGQTPFDGFSAMQQRVDANLTPGISFHQNQAEADRSMGLSSPAVTKKNSGFGSITTMTLPGVPTSTQEDTGGYIETTLAEQPNEDVSKFPKSAEPKATPLGDGDATEYDKLRKQNAWLYGAMGAANVGGLLYNIFSRRSAAGTPPDYQPKLLDLKVDAYRAKMDADRARAFKTGLYNTRGVQNIGRNMAAVANNAQAAIQIGALTEEKENQQEIGNTNIMNDYLRTKYGRLYDYQMREEASENAFRAAKGEAITGQVGSLMGLTSNFFNNQNMLSMTEDRNKFNERLLKWQEANPEMYNVYLSQLYGQQKPA